MLALTSEEIKLIEEIVQKQIYSYIIFTMIVSIVGWLVFKLILFPLSNKITDYYIRKSRPKVIAEFEEKWRKIKEEDREKYGR